MSRHAALSCHKVGQALAATLGDPDWGAFLHASVWPHTLHSAQGEVLLQNLAEIRVCETWSHQIEYFGPSLPCSCPAGIRNVLPVSTLESDSLRIGSSCFSW